jgi:hypothetical protein
MKRLLNLTRFYISILHGGKHMRSKVFGILFFALAAAAPAFSQSPSLTTEQVRGEETGRAVGRTVEAESSEKKPFIVGRGGRVFMPVAFGNGASADIVGLAVDSWYVGDLLKAWILKDRDAIHQMVQHDDFFAVSPGTNIETIDVDEVTVIDKKQLVVKIRVLEGRYKGSAGWVPAEWIKY